MHTVPGPIPLGSAYIACREAQTVAALHKAGSAFQRQLDDALGSGSCRIFPKGYRIRDARVDTTLRAFRDPGNGVRYWAYVPG